MVKSVRGQIFFFWRGIIFFSIVSNISEQLFMLESKYDQYQRGSGFHWNWEGDLGPLFPLGLVQQQKYQSSTGLFLKVSWISLNLPEQTFRLAWIFLLNARRITEAQSALAIIPAEFIPTFFLHSTVLCNYIKTDNAVHKAIKNMNSNILLPFFPPH